MDPAVLSTISALSGTVIGAISSLGTTWMTTKAQARAARIAAERSKREDLYGRFMDETAKLYASALNHVGVDYERLTGLYALSGRIKLYASAEVANGANDALKFLVDLSLKPPMSAEDMRIMMDSTDANIIDRFATACRAELANLA